jgi:hypothetical protein
MPTQAQISPAYDLGNVFALVGVHLHQAADALRLAGARIQHRVARRKMARIDADKAQLAKWIVDQLEAQRRERRESSGA